MESSIERKIREALEAVDLRFAAIQEQAGLDVHWEDDGSLSLAKASGEQIELSALEALALANWLEVHESDLTLEFLASQKGGESTW